LTLFVVLRRSDRKNVKLYQYNMAAAVIFGKSKSTYLMNCFTDRHKNRKKENKKKKKEKGKYAEKV